MNPPAHLRERRIKENLNYRVLNNQRYAKNNTTTTFFAFASLVSNAQTFNAISLSVGQLNGKPDLSEDEDWIWRSFPERISGKKGLYAEAMVSMEIKPRFSIGAGLHFSRLSFTHLVTGIRLGEDIINGTTTSFSKDISMTNIGIPVQAGYDVFHKKIRLQVNAGLVTLKTFSESSETKVTGAGANDPVIAAQGLGKSTDVEGVRLAPFSGLELSYPVLKHLLLKLGGRYQWFLFSDGDFYENAKGNIRASGFSAGLEYRI